MRCRDSSLGGDDSQEIFYSLNSQGKPLSQSDLLRSLIFMRAEKEKVNRDAIFAEFWAKLKPASGAGKKNEAGELTQSWILA